MATAINAPADVKHRSAPIAVEDTPYLIPSFYDARWHNEHLDAVVTIDGVPVAGGSGECREVLTVGMVPPWRRYALQDDSSEALSQDVFHRRHVLAMQEYVWEKSNHQETLAFPEKEPVQDIKHFLAWKIHPNEPAKLIPLGTDLDRRPRRPEKFYDPRSEREVKWTQLTPEQQETISKALADRGIEEPQKPEETPAIEAEPVAAESAQLFTAPCGKTSTTNAGIAAHKRHCASCQEQEG